MRGPFIGSMALHFLVVLVMIFGSRLGVGKKLPLPTATTVKLVRPMSTPVSQPSKQEEQVTPESKPPLEIPLEKKDKSEVKPKPVEEPEKPKPRSVLPKLEKRGESGNVLKLKNPGFDYDFYLGSVQAKIETFFRAPAGVKGQLVATVGFVIQKNGTIANIQLVKRSGNSLLDMAAERAIRSAARFGPLPPQYDQDHVEINYEFVVNPGGR